MTTDNENYIVLSCSVTYAIFPSVNFAEAQDVDAFIAKINDALCVARNTNSTQLVLRLGGSHSQAAEILQAFGFQEAPISTRQSCAWEIEVASTPRAAEDKTLGSSCKVKGEVKGEAGGEVQGTNSETASHNAITRQELAHLLRDVFGEDTPRIAFCAHPTDEATTFAGAMFSSSEQKNNAIVLCSGAHARDAAALCLNSRISDAGFTDSCALLGVEGCKIAIDEAFVQENQGSDPAEKACKALIGKYARLYPEATFVTYAPITSIGNDAIDEETYSRIGSIERISNKNDQVTWLPQDASKLALGRSLSELCNEGFVQVAIFCVEPYHLQQFCSKQPNKLLLCHEATAAEEKKLDAALRVYEKSASKDCKVSSAELAYTKENPCWYAYSYHAPKPLFAKWCENATEKEKQEAHKAYELFTEAFVKPNPSVFQDFSNFVYKHYQNPFAKSATVLFDTDSPKSAGAMICCVNYPFVLQDGSESNAACLADFAAGKNAKPFSALKAVSKIKPAAQAQDCAFSYVDGTDAASAIQMKFGYIPLDGFEAYDVKLPRGFSKHFDIRNYSASDYSTCPFSKADFQAINACESDAIRGKRSAEFFEHFVDNLPNRQFAYIVVRHRSIEESKASAECDKINGDAANNLAGYAVVELLTSSVNDSYKNMRIADWRICSNNCADKQDIVAAILSHCAINVKSVSWNHINSKRGDYEWLKNYETSEIIWEGKPEKDKLLVLPLSTLACNATSGMENWRLTLLDRDFFVNTLPGQ